MAIGKDVVVEKVSEFVSYPLLAVGLNATVEESAR
jgi:hypothetical protein